MATKSQAVNTSFLDKMTKIEELGEEVLAHRHQLVDLDKKRQGNREATRSLKAKENSREKSWLCIGNTFFKLENAKISKILQQDQEEINKEIDQTKVNLKDKMANLHELEGLPNIDRFSLASLSSDDLKYVNGI